MAKRYSKKSKSIVTVVAAPYRQVSISGILTLKSELHIGSSTTKNTGANEIERDAKGRPYLPGSSLRGALASLLDQSELSEHYRRLFGLARQSSPEGEGALVHLHDEGGMGLLKVYDACLCEQDGEAENATLKAIERSRTRIEPVTGTAMEHHLATHELVPVGTCFRLNLVLDHAGNGESGITDEEVEAVLNLLSGLNEQSLGMGKSIGQGRLAWKKTLLEVVTETDYRLWLLNNLQQKAKNTSKVTITPLSTISKPLERSDDTIQLGGNWTRQSFTLSSLSPILINDPQAVKKAEEDSGDSFNHLFLQRYQDGKPHAVIPGSTLKGWFRAQSRRILLTLTQGDKQAVVDKLLGQLFGSTEHGSSLIQFDDALVPITADDTHTQMFNAVDRFTGGVKDSALFSASALWVNKPIVGQLRFKEPLMKGWMRLLLLYVWGDAKEGDLVLGWGKSKGYGRLLLEITNDDERNWLEKPEINLCEEWQAELSELLGLSYVEAGHE